MNHAARLLGLALSSALLMPIAQIPSVLKPLKAAQAFEANEIPGLVGAVSEALHPSTSAEPWEPYMTALILAQDSGRDHPPAQESSDRCILTADQVEQLANAPDHRIRATAATLWAYSFFAKGKSLYFRNRFEEAIQCFEQALALYQESGEWRRLADQTQVNSYSDSYSALILSYIGTTYQALGNYPAALDYHQQSLTRFRELGEKVAEVHALQQISAIYQLLGNNSEAEVYLAQSLSLFHELGDQPGEFNALPTPRNPDPVTPEEGALQDRSSEAFGLFWEGELAYDASQFGRALALFWQALNIYQEIDDQTQQAWVHNAIGAVLLELGHSAGLNYLEQSLSLFREVGDQNAEATVLANLGGAYALFDNDTKALDYLQQSLILYRELGDQEGEANALNNIGLAYVVREDYSEALDYFRQALEKHQELEDDLSVAHAFGNIGFAHQFLGNYPEALSYFEQSLAIYRKRSNRGRSNEIPQSVRNNAEVVGYGLFGQINYQAITDSGEIVFYSEQARRHRDEEAGILGNIGRLFREQGQPELAIIFLKSSVELYETIREELRNSDINLQQSYTNRVDDNYRLLADLLLQQGRIPEAQQVLDLLKLEELREFTDTRAVWTSDGLQLTAAEQTVADAHGSLIALGADVVECERTNCPDIETLYDRQQTLLAQYDREVARFTATIRDNQGDDGIFQDPESISGDAQDLLEAYAAEGETALLIYPFVLEDKLWLVWATVGNVIGSVEVPVARGELSTTVQRLGELLQNGDTRNIADLQAASQQLYDWLIAPLEGELAANDIDHLVFVNDRVTRYIPMAVLHDGERYLLERYTLSTVLAPGATEMDDRLGSVPETPVLGLGVTRPIGDFNALPAVGPELAAIVQGPEGDGVYPGQVFLDEAFTLDALERNVADHRVLHIATHAEFVPGRKEESYILLGDGSPLRIPDIERIERRLNNLHLVVLSACQTALGGPDQDGAEIAGLSSYFLEARRAEAVIASLWSVNDTSTSVLMQRFYALLATGDFTKSEALRQAQLSLLNGEDLAALADRLATTRAGARPVLETGTELPTDLGHRHPYHWAPFILIGNGL